MAKKKTGIESYAMVVFASQWPDHPELRPAKTHSFAAFIQEKPDGTMETHIISWLPRSGIIDGFLQIGANYSLPDTLDWSFTGGMAVYAWHPYEIKDVLFNSALTRIADLESGHYRYYFLGMGGRNINCTHALSDLDILPDLGTFVQSGVNASRECLRRMLPWSWQSSTPGKYEAVLNLPPKKITFLPFGSDLVTAESLDPNQYYVNFAKDLPHSADGPPQIRRG
jgi:hypothetical protein